MDEMCAIPANIQGSACPMSSHNLANRQEVQPLEISDFNICTIIFTHEIIRKLRYANSPIGVLQSLLKPNSMIQVSDLISKESLIQKHRRRCENGRPKIFL